MEAVKGCSVVDIFCGAGGLSHGFVLEGFKVLAGIDSDDSCKYAYETNNHARFIAKQIEDIQSSEIDDLYPRTHTKILVGCAPCQPFSQYTKKKKRDDEKWKLLYLFSEMIDTIKPEIVSMENVPELIKFNGGKVFRDFVERLSKHYHITYYLVYCPDYGIPQNRSRLVLFASVFGPVDLIEKTHKPNEYKTVWQTISHLPSIAAGDICQSDPLHRSSALSEMNLQRIRQSKPGGTWRDWDPDLLAECHKKDSGQSYDSVYGRMEWHRPSPTITTECNGYGNGRFGHPTQDRAISMREAALLQTFPSNYQFVDPSGVWYIEKIARMIGNAVPVDLGRVIALSIKQHMARYKGK